MAAVRKRLKTDFKVLGLTSGKIALPLEWEILGGRTCLGIEKKSKNLSFNIKLRCLIGILVNM